jgi:hypothetical protein
MPSATAIYDTIRSRRGSTGSSEHAVQRSQGLKEVVAAVQALPERQRDAIVLRELEGRSYEEIADELGVSDGAVRQLLNRARNTLRAGGTAVVPLGLAARLPWSDSAEPVSARVAELCGGAGAGAVAAKVCATALVTGAVVGGVAVAPGGDEGHRHTDDPRHVRDAGVSRSAQIGAERFVDSSEGSAEDRKGPAEGTREDRSGPGRGGRGSDRSGRRGGEDVDDERSGPGSGGRDDSSGPRPTAEVSSRDDGSGSPSGSSGSGTSGSGSSGSGSSGSGSSDSGSSGSGTSGAGTSGSSGPGSSGPGSGTSGSSGAGDTFESSGSGSGSVTTGAEVESGTSGSGGSGSGSGVSGSD